MFHIPFDHEISSFPGDQRGFQNYERSQKEYFPLPRAVLQVFALILLKDLRQSQSKVQEVKMGSVTHH